ncbi:hypothetical protein JOM56_002640 [Amanita muscaria]
MSPMQPQIDPNWGGVTGPMGHGSDPSAQHTLRQASHSDLMQAGNSAYMQLFITKMQLETQLSAQVTLVQQLQGIIQSIKDPKMMRRSSHRNSHTPNNSPMRRLGHDSSYSSQFTQLQIPPLPPALDQDDYPDATFWTSQSWQDYVNKQSEQGEKVPKLSFICNEDGDFVGAARIKSMTDTAKKLWADLHHHRLAPATWRLVSKHADAYYSNNMRITYPEFQLCDENWKIKMFATIRFPDWSNGARATGKLTRAIPSISMHTSTTSTNPSNRKRAHESGKNVESLAKRRRPNTQPTNVLGLTSISDTRSSSPSAHPAPATDASSSDVPTEVTHVQPKPRPLHAPIAPSYPSAQIPQTVTTTSASPNIALAETVVSTPAVPAAVQAETIPTVTSVSLDSRTGSTSPPPIASNTTATSANTVTCPASATPTPDIGLTEAHDVRSSESSALSVSTPTVPSNAPTTSHSDSQPLVRSLPGRVTRNRKADAFANLDIPAPAEEIAYKPPSAEELAKAKAAKQKKVARKLVPKPTTALTVRNLFLIDFRNEHGDNATAEDFNAAWKSITEDKTKEYKARVNARKAEALKTIAQSTLEPTTAAPAPAADAT